MRLKAITSKAFNSSPLTGGTAYALVTFNSAGAVVKNGWAFSDSTGGLSANFDQRCLYKAPGGPPLATLDWKNSGLIPDSGLASVRWNAYLLNDINGTTQIDWNNKILNGVWSCAGFSTASSMAFFNGFGVFTFQCNDTGGNVIQMQLRNSTNFVHYPATQYTASWVDAATLKTRITHVVYDTVAREFMRCESTGAAAAIGFLGAAAAIQQTGGAATAGGAYTATEQSMLQKVYNALRTFGLLS